MRDAFWIAVETIEQRNKELEEFKEFAYKRNLEFTALVEKLNEAQKEIKELRTQLERC